jgi:isopenicillin-N epimerase
VADPDLPPLDWQLAPGVAQLNHGGMGAVPAVVAAAAERVRRDVEADPTAFYLRRLPGLLGAAREQVAGFLNADPGGLVFTVNATAAVQTVLASLTLEPGGEVVTTDHAYGAVRVQLGLLARRSGARLRVVAVPLPAVDPADVAARVLAGLGRNTRLLVVDQVASPSGLCFPVAEIVAGAAARGVPVLIDGAHAPGLLPVDLAALQPDFWAGNLHKWVCGPKTAAALWVAPRWREVVRPLVPSHHYAEGFLPAFDWTGTVDPAPVLAAPAAIELFSGLGGPGGPGGAGWPAIRERNRALAAAGAGLVAEALGTSVPVGDALAAAMRVVELPRVLAEPEAREVERRLADDHGIEVVVMDLGGHRLLRLSAQLYNTSGDFRRLAAVLPEVLPEVLR